MKPDFDLSDLSTTALPVEDVATELHDGVHLERRGVLQLGAMGGLFGLARGEESGATSQRVPPGAMEFEAFVEESLALAEAAVAASEPHEDSYLLRIAAMMTRLASIPKAKASAYGEIEGLRVARHARRMPLNILELRLEPHAVIPLHNHKGYAGNLIGLEGELRITSYDAHPDGGADLQAEHLLLRQTSEALMTPGRVATLATQRDNYHSLVAGPQGARALDMFTFFSDPGRSEFFEVASKARDPELRIFEAWPVR